MLYFVLIVDQGMPLKKPERTRTREKKINHVSAIMLYDVASEGLVLLFVALWFILRGDLLYVFPCVILFLCFSVLLVLRLPRLGKRELILVLFVRLFGLCLLDLSVSSSSWGLGRAAVCNCGTPWAFLLPFSITSCNKNSNPLVD